MAGVCAEFSQHYVEPLENLVKGDSVRNTLKEILLKIKSGRAGINFLHVYLIFYHFRFFVQF